MDRSSFPTLTESATGWPVLAVPWDARGRTIEVEVTEENDGAGAVVIVRSPFPVRVVTDPIP